MSHEIRQLQPEKLWNKFADLNAIPRPSKKEERVIAFMKEFGNSLQLSTEVDNAGNVLIKKPATPGMEDRQTVVLQSHLDMVHQKNAATDFDFSSQGINMYEKDGWVRAKGTTLGADNGIGVATIMAILESNDIKHPALEALFTIDEETGMTGAFRLKPDWLSGTILLNLDTEEDDEIGIGCAGGIDVNASLAYEEEQAPSNTKTYQLVVKGLQGGHSGMDINKGLGNANKIMNRLLRGVQAYKVRLSSLEGGSLRNAIPRESFATIAVDFTSGAIFEKKIEELAEAIKQEYSKTDPDLEIKVDRKKEEAVEVVPEDIQTNILSAMEDLHNGVYKMSSAIPDLVETSNNIAKVTVKNGKAIIQCLTRSSVESEKEKLVTELSEVLESKGFSVKAEGSYPGWTPNRDSKILKVLEKIYEQQNGSKAHVAACHAGLECGIIGQHYPEMDMISFGPTIKGAHSPDERVSISSVQKYWKFVKEILENIPE